MRAERNGHGRERAADVEADQRADILAGRRKAVHVDVQRDGQNGDQHGPAVADLFRDRDRDEGQKQVDDGVDRADDDAGTQRPARVGCKLCDEHAQGGAHADVDEDDQEGAEGGFIAGKFFVFHVSSSFSFLFVGGCYCRPIAA